MKSVPAVLLASLLLSLSRFAPAADAPSGPVPSKLAATQAAERDLWVGHIFWVREVSRALAEKNQAAADAAEKQVVANAKQIAGSIEDERIQKRAQRYLRDLRRDAVIDYN